MMGELISMLSSPGIDESPLGPRRSSTLRVLTQISRRYLEHLTRLSTTPERMVTSFMNVARDLENLELFDMDVIAYGQMLSLNKIKMNFCSTYATWLRGTTFYIFNRLRDSQNVSSHYRPQFMSARHLIRSDANESLSGMISPESESTEVDEGNL